MIENPNYRPNDQEVTVKPIDYNTRRSVWRRKLKDEKYDKIDELRRRRDLGEPLEMLEEESFVVDQMTKAIAKSNRDLPMKVEKNDRQKSRKIGLLNRIRSQNIEEQEISPEQDEDFESYLAEANKTKWSF